MYLQLLAVKNYYYLFLAFSLLLKKVEKSLKKKFTSLLQHVRSETVIKTEI